MVLLFSKGSLPPWMLPPSPPPPPPPETPGSKPDDPESTEQDEDEDDDDDKFRTTPGPPLWSKPCKFLMWGFSPPCWELPMFWWLGFRWRGWVSRWGGVRANRSSTWWSSLQKRPSCRRANSSPGISCFSQATHRKHSRWKILFLALITKSVFPKDRLHFSHLVPNNLDKR